MIVSLVGTLIEASAASCVLEVCGVGYELGISSSTYAQLPPVGSSDVRLYVRMRSRDDLPVLFGFSSQEERQVFDRLCAISSVGPKAALAVLSSFSPSELAACVASQDVARMTQVPGIGKKTASRLVLELEGLFAPGGELGTLAGAAGAGAGGSGAAAASAVSGMAAIEADATTALLGMGFTQREIELALEGMEEAGVTNDAEALTYALKRVGGLR